MLHGRGEDEDEFRPLQPGTLQESTSQETGVKFEAIQVYQRTVPRHNEDRGMEGLEFGQDQTTMDSGEEGEAGRDHTTAMAGWQERISKVRCLQEKTEHQ